MTKQSVVPVEAVLTVITVAATEAVVTSSSIFAAYPPPLAPLRKKFLPQLDLAAGGTARIARWVESMKASSPTHAKAALAAASADDHLSWAMRHPSALSKFEQIASAAAGKKVVVFLDYDGTLSPIVDDPDAAFMTDAMRKAVQKLARRFPTAIVSGRCLDKVMGFVNLGELYYAGSHGMDIKGPEKSTAKSILFQPAREFLPMIEEVYRALTERTESTAGAKVENNKFCLSVHFRCVDEKNWGALFEQVRSVLKEYPKLLLTQGRKVLEIRPTIKWDKGRALEFLLESLGFNDLKEVMPIYIGDDRTDEDAFKVLKERGQGIGILVSKTAKETNASYSLQEPAEVKHFLNRLAKWKDTPAMMKARSFQSVNT